MNWLTKKLCESARWSLIGVVLLGLLPAALEAQSAEPAIATSEPASPGSVPLAAATPLEVYVRSPDPNYSFEVMASHKSDGYTTHVVLMTSQAWLTRAEVDRPLWWHWLVIVEPDEVQNETALLYIGGGDNDDEQPTEAPALLLPIAKATGSVVAELRMVPNQPLTFAGDDFGPRKEDELIAYGWDKFLRGGARDHDALWLARLPMTKSAVRAMDTISSVLQEREHVVNSFVVAGGSKRGWTTWTTAAVDDRVVGIVPFVIDMLNTVPSFNHHWRAYGFWSPAVGDYKREGIMEWQGREEYQKLLAITEPYSYRERLTLPKLIVNASGDEFFLPDSWQFYWKELQGQKYLRYVPNTGHSLAGTDAASSLGAFFKMIVEERPLPILDWSIDGNSIEVVVDEEHLPATVKLWQAHNDKTRDFRVVRIKETWQESTVEPTGPGRYTAEVDTPEDGWAAFFVELTYPVGPFELKVTSGVNVVPETLPFEVYEPDVSQLPEVDP